MKEIRGKAKANVLTKIMEEEYWKQLNEGISIHDLKPMDKEKARTIIDSMDNFPSKKN